MGGLARKMPITYITYIAGTLALAGIFPFAGFWSKDEILGDSWLAGLVDNKLGGYIALAVLIAAAGMTAFYMWRQIVLVFHGGPRTEAADHAVESAPSMTIPLIILGVLSVVAGFMNTPSDVLGLDRIFGAHRFTDWLTPSIAHAHVSVFQPLIAIGALLIAVGAMILANRIYTRHTRIIETGRDPLQVSQSFGAIWTVANARMYWDQFYGRVFEQPFNRAAAFLSDRVDWAFLHDYVHDTVIKKGFDSIGTLLSKPVDTGIIDGTVNGIGRVAQWISGGMRRVQTGYVRTYAISLLLGVVLVIIVLLLPLLNR